MDMKRVCEEYYSTVYGYLLTITGGNYDLAEELTQETFYRAIKNAGQFRGDCKMTTWLCQIAKYTFYQHLDKKNRRKEVSIEEALKDVLMLRLSGELSFREIGEILGKTENWARVTFYRGKQILGKELSGNE